MMKKAIMYSITIVISATIILTVGVPHHISESAAAELACEYFNYRMDDPEITIKSYSVWREYARTSIDDQTGDSYIQMEQRDQVGLLTKIYDYWNPNFKNYSVYIEADMGSGREGAFTIKVDAYTSFVFDGMEEISWRR